MEKVKLIINFLTEQNKLTRSWTKEETLKYKNMNDELLKELNATLQPSKGEKTGKIGIFCAGQIGDTAQVMGILKYWDELFPGKEAVWFINAPNCDLLRYSNVSEVRPWPWAGNGLGAGESDHWPYLCNPDNTLNLELAKTRHDTADLQGGFFPATHQVASEKREGLEYSNVSKKIFGVPDDWEWHPYLSFSFRERMVIEGFISTLPKNKKNILLETFAGSGQSPFYTVETTKNIMRICREKLGECNFIFGSHKHVGGENNIGLLNADLFDRNDRSCTCPGYLTPRQIALINDYCDLMIGISSGISVVTSAWGLKKTKKIQWCGSKICSTSAIANGEFHLVTTDFKTKEVADKEFFTKLEEILGTI